MNLNEFREEYARIKTELKALNISNICDPLVELTDEINVLNRDLEYNKSYVREVDNLLDEVNNFIKTKVHLYNEPESDKGRGRIIELLSSFGVIKKTVFRTCICSDYSNNFTSNGFPCKILKKMLFDDNYQFTLTSDALMKGVFVKDHPSDGRAFVKDHPSDGRAFVKDCPPWQSGLVKDHTSLDTECQAYVDSCLLENYIPVLLEQIKQLNEEINIYFLKDIYSGEYRYDMRPDLKKKHKFNVIQTSKYAFIFEMEVMYCDYEEVIQYDTFNIKTHEYDLCKRNISIIENNIRLLHENKNKISSLMKEYSELNKNFTSLGYKTYELDPYMVRLLTLNSFFGVNLNDIKQIEGYLTKKRCNLCYFCWSKQKNENNKWECLSDNPNLYVIKNIQNMNFNNYTEKSIVEFTKKFNIELYSNGYGGFYLNDEVKDIFQLDVTHNNEGEWINITMFINIYVPKLNNAPQIIQSIDQSMIDLVQRL